MITLVDCQRQQVKVLLVSCRNSSINVESPVVWKCIEISNGGIA